MNPIVPDDRAKRVELILQQLEELPTLPTVAVLITDSIASAGPSGRALHAADEQRHVTLQRLARDR